MVQDARTTQDAPATPVEAAPEHLRRFAASLRELGARRSVDEALQLSVDLATELIDGVDVADILFTRPDGVTVPVSSDPAARQLAQAQEDTGEGPCLTTLESADRVVSHDLGEDDRWPAFTARALDLGFRSVTAYRLFIRRGDGTVLFGALDLFGREPGLDHSSIEFGEVFAAHCATVLDAAINSEGLEEALSNRDVIGQAKGILMERHRIGPDDAYDLLRQASNNRNVKLREIAHEVAETGELQGVEP